MAGNKKKAERYLYMEQNEINLLLSCAYKYNLLHGLLWDIIFNGGLRVSEALNIRPIDIDYTNNKIKIRTLKQKSEEPTIDEVLFPAKVITISKKITTVYAIKSNDKIFNFSRQWAWQSFKSLLKKCKLSNLYSPHALRHSHGVIVAELTKGDIVKIAHRLRHRSPTNAWRYTHLTNAAQREIVDYLDKLRDERNELL